MKHTNETCSHAVLAVSFGTTDSVSLKYEIGAVERAVAAAMSGFAFRRAFSSQYIIDRLRQRDGIQIDNIKEALERAAKDGIAVLAVQPTYFTYGYEYEKLADTLHGYKDAFDQIYLGKPLLHSDADLTAAAEAAALETAVYDDGKTAVCFMGHGTNKAGIISGVQRSDAECSAQINYNDVYIKMQEKLTDAGYQNHYIAVMQASPSFEELTARLYERNTYQRAVLMPLMLSAGMHAEREMAGAGKDSWKYRLEQQGFEVACVMEGFGRIPSIQNLYAAHAKAACSLK